VVLHSRDTTLDQQEASVFNQLSIPLSLLILYEKKVKQMEKAGSVGEHSDKVRRGV
jgi:hypothetical protein